MEDLTYRVVLEGQLLDGVSLDDAVRRVAALFRRREDDIRLVLDGSRRRVATGKALVVATQYVEALKQAGVLAHIEFEATELTLPAPHTPAAAPETRQTSEPAGPAPRTAALPPELVSKAAPTSSSKPLAEPVLELWNPNAAGLWSFLFTPIFGSMLIAKNWETMGEPGRASAARWSITAFLVIGALVEYFAPHTEKAAAIIFLVVWYFVINRPQAHAVRKHFGGEYERRPWGFPLAIATLALIVFTPVYIALQKSVATGSTDPQGRAATARDVAQPNPFDQFDSKQGSERPTAARASAVTQSNLYDPFDSKERFEPSRSLPFCMSMASYLIEAIRQTLTTELAKSNPNNVSDVRVQLLFTRDESETTPPRCVYQSRVSYSQRNLRFEVTGDTVMHLKTGGGLPLVYSQSILDTYSAMFRP